MAVVGIGTDLTSITRVRRLLEHYGPRFRERVFSAAECTQCDLREDPAAHYAARFAAKEAAFKAMGLGRSGNVLWSDATVASLGGGLPTLHFHGALAHRAAEAQVTHAHLSLSHEGDMALAFVLLENTNG